MTKSSGDSAQLQNIQIYLALHTQLDNDIYGHILNDINKMSNPKWKYIIFFKSPLGWIADSMLHLLSTQYTYHKYVHLMYDL